VLRSHCSWLAIYPSILALLAIPALAGCEVGGGGAPDAQVDAPPPRCGNGVVEAGEACEPGDLGGATCQSQGYQGGTLACDPATCELDTSGCQECGDGRVTGDEECDGAELAGQDCQSAGYAGGQLACNPATCTLDVSGCDGVATLRNDDGTCNVHLGCTNNNNPGASGNPQSLVECFTGEMAPPFSLTSMTYIVSTQTPPPDALNLEVYTWTGRGLPGARIASVPLQAANLAHGPQTIAVDPPITIPTRDFCVGINGASVDDGFRLLFSGTSTVEGASWIDAVTCNLNGFRLVADAPVSRAGNWCMSATIEKAQ
jgi:hypothetical protein